MAFLDGINPLLLFVAIVADILVALYIFRVTQAGGRRIREAWEAFNTYIEEWRNGTLLDGLIGKDEEGEIVIDERLGVLVKAIGSTFAQSAKMSLLQGLGAQAKLDKGLKEAISKDIIEEKFPLFDVGAGFLEDFTGFNVKQYITKNPQAIPQLVKLAGPLLGMKGSQRNDGGSVPTMT